MRVEIIPCLQDNYSYVIIDESNNEACVIDMYYVLYIMYEFIVLTHHIKMTYINQAW